MKKPDNYDNFEKSVVEKYHLKDVKKYNSMNAGELRDEYNLLADIINKQKEKAGYEKRFKKFTAEITSDAKKDMTSRLRIMQEFIKFLEATSAAKGLAKKLGL